jgi:hypothetical protein
MNYAQQLDRKDLVLAVWAAEFTRTLAGAPSAKNSAALLQCLAERAAESADRAVEALRLFLTVEFRVASYDELDRCYMTWEKFVGYCTGSALTEDDGHGELATDDHHVSNVRVYVGDAIRSDYDRPTWATHVCWYNK